MLASRLPAASAEYTAQGGRHLVIDAAGMRHRLWVLDADPSASLVILLPMAGEIVPIAVAAARAFAANPCPGPDPALQLSDFQRQRLARLLAILDAAGGGASNREIGTSLIYPWLAGIGAQAWKASSERRHTQRLIAEAEAMMCGGYRRLLAGRAAEPV